MFGGAAEKCNSCGKRVYPTEKINILNAVWHTACFKCSVCGMKLTLKNYAGLGGVPYCKHHYPAPGSSDRDATVAASGQSAPNYQSGVAPAVQWTGEDDSSSHGYSAPTSAAAPKAAPAPKAAAQPAYSAPAPVHHEPAPAAEEAEAEGQYDEYGNWWDQYGGYYDPEGNYHEAGTF